MLNKKRIGKILVTIAVLCMYAGIAYAAGGDPVDNLGFKFLNAARKIGYWVCLAKAVMTVIKAAIDEDIFGCWKTVLGYVIAFASLYYLPQLFDAVKM